MQYAFRPSFGLLMQLTKLTANCAMLLALVVGCRAKAPPLETWPVRGSVVDQNGERPTGGAVRLLTMNDADLITVGPIQPDGSFKNLYFWSSSGSINFFE